MKKAYDFESPNSTDITMKPEQLQCGAVLISNHSIITAAHCLQNCGLVALTGAGSHSQENYEVPASKQIKHPNYSSIYMTNDIAVLNVSKNISYNKSVFPAIIPIKTPKHRAPSTVCGWGSISYPGLEYPEDLTCADNFILDNTNCRSYYGNDIREGMVCAMTSTFEEDACTGDSGGPLFDWFSYDDLGDIAVTEEVVGLVSWGKGCGTQPGVYTDIYF